MALFENYEGRMPQLQPVLDKYGFKTFNGKIRADICAVFDVLNANTK